MHKKIKRLLRPNLTLYIICLFLFAAASFVTRQYALASVEFGAVFLLLGGYIIHRSYRRRNLQAYIQKLSEAAGVSMGTQTPFPVVTIRMDDEVVVYVNDAFTKLTGYSDTINEKRLDELLPGFSAQWLASGKTESPYDITIAKRRYRVYGTVLQAEDILQTRLGVLYFSDLTELYQVRDEYIRSRPVVSIILVDNFEELTRNLTEGASAALSASLNTAITNWTESYSGLLRRLDRNRFLFLFEKRDLSRAINDKFSLLEDIHKISSPSGLAASISFGLGVDGANFEEAFNFASLAIEMALSRGGDQAVIKDRINFSFYGGRTKEFERRSKVRSRVTANSLMELIGQSSQVFIMGHKNADMDALGAAMGISCLCRKKGKPAYIVLDKENNVAKQLLKEISAVAEYKDTFVSGQEAMLLSDSRSTLVVVDTNRPDQVEYRPLLESMNSVCVIDHHRRAADYITPVVVNLHEPYASSASELATEVLEYAVEKTDVLPIEAKALLAGIYLDTKSFNIRTGERTFEAAAYLRQLGADTVEVKKLMQNDFQDTITKYQIIKSARLYREEIAISALNAGVPRVLAAQAADELLSISGITASFVLYPDDNQIIISARSIGAANVQVILEPLGGGGNAATAGAQVQGGTVKDVLDRLVASIDQFFEM